MTAWLRNQGYAVNRKRVTRLMRQMGLEAIYTKPQLSQAAEGHVIYPYLLRGVKIERVNHVWSTDITYIRLQQGFIYLVAVIDWWSRYVLSWAVSITLDSAFCLEALETALGRGRPEIFNTDQGAQFTSRAFTERLRQGGVQIAWMAVVGPWITCLWSGCGGLSSTKRYIYGSIIRYGRPNRG
jgi:putative transposase